MFARPSPTGPSCELEPPSTRARAADSEALLSKPFVLMLCVQFCFGLSYSSFFLLPKYLTREFHASASAIGAVTAVGLLAGVIATPWIGAAIDRGSRRASILCGALVNAVCTGLFVYVHTISLPLYLLRAVHGMSYALVFNALVTIAADLAPPKKLSQAIGLCGAAGMLSNAIAPAIAERIADHQGWGLVFLLAAGAALFAALVSLGIGDGRAAGESKTVETATELDAKAADAVNDDAPSAWTLVRDPRRFGAFVCSAAAGAGFGVMFTFTQPFALAHGANHVSNFFIGYTVSALTVRLFLGGLADRFGRHRVAFGALVLYGLVACMTSQLRPNLLFPVGVCLGVAHGLLYPAINALGAEGVPRARRGAVISYFGACFYGGFALWVFAAGRLAQTTGYPAVFLLSALLLWSSLLCLPRKARGLAA
jgi:MFS family permease